MNLGKRISYSLLLILLFFAINSFTYYWGNSERSEGLEALQLAIGAQLRAHETKQLLENKNDDLRVLQALKETTGDMLARDELSRASAGIDTIAATVGSLGNFSSESSRDAYHQLEINYAQLEQVWLEFIDTYNSQDVNTSAETLTEAYRNVLSALSTYQSRETANAEQQTAQINKTIEIIDKINMFVFLFSIFLTCALGLVLIRHTNRSLQELQRGVENVYEGDLNYRIPVMSKDELGALAEMFNNMSERLQKAMNQVQRAKENADNANKAKSVFLANMSHELRTPLNAIIGYGELIQEMTDEHESLSSEEIAEDIDRITRAGKHLAALINDILDLSKIEAGKTQLYHEWFEANAIISEVVEAIRPLAGAGGNHIVMELTEPLPKQYSDATKFRQIMYNLLSNACKFSDGGKITVRSNIVEEHGMDYLQFAVKDSGIGMTEDQTQHIFDSFVQADSSTTKKYGGTGLGLTISRQFCELMGGDLFVRSAKDKGTTFYLQLPATEVPDSAELDEREVEFADED